MTRVADILAVKGSHVHRVGPDTMAYTAIAVMVGNGVGSLLVTESDEILGIFTERDYLRRVVLQDREGRETRVRDVMSPSLVTVGPQQRVEECMAIMTQRRIRHLPVLDRSRLAGLISIGDLVKYLSREREAEVRHLTDYITGRA